MFLSPPKSSESEVKVFGKARFAPATAPDSSVTIGKAVLTPKANSAYTNKEDGLDLAKYDIYSRDDIIPSPVSSPPPVSAPAPPPPPPGLVMATESDDTPEPQPAVTAKPDEEDEFIKTIAKRRNWGRTLPTNNPHVLHALLKEPNPFKQQPQQQQQQQQHGAGGISAQHIAAQLDRAIYTHPKYANTAAFQHQAGDVIVLGLPRSGQTPILRILDMLQAQSATPPTTTRLLENAMWVENATGWISRANANAANKRRLVKSHLLGALDALQAPTTTMPPRIIVVLRHPADLRLANFRHLRRMYTKCTNTDAARFDEAIKMEDFAHNAIPLPATSHARNGATGLSPEQYIAQAVRAVEQASSASNNILLVFYEELLFSPVELVARIARFTNFMRDVMGTDPFADRGTGNTFHGKQNKTAVMQEDDATKALLRGIAETITSDVLHPSNQVRQGSSGQASVCFSKQALHRLEQEWNVGSGFAEYASLYSATVGQRYPFAAVQTTGLGRLSNLLLPQGGGASAKKQSNLHEVAEEEEGHAGGKKSSSALLFKRTSSLAATSSPKRGSSFSRRTLGSFFSFGSSSSSSRGSNLESSAPMSPTKLDQVALKSPTKKGTTEAFATGKELDEDVFYTAKAASNFKYCIDPDDDEADNALLLLPAIQEKQ